MRKEEPNSNKSAIKRPGRHRRILWGIIVLLCAPLIAVCSVGSYVALTERSVELGTTELSFRAGPLPVPIEIPFIEIRNFPSSSELCRFGVCVKTKCEGFALVIRERAIVFSRCYTLNYQEYSYAMSNRDPQDLLAYSLPNPSFIIDSALI